MKGDKSMDFTGRTVVVTGGSSGIGRSICVRFAEHGANVVVCGRNIEQLKKTVEACEKTGAKAIYVKMDVTSEADANEMAKKAAETFGTLDIIVNNAGIVNTIKPIEETTVDEWDLCMAVNAKGPFICSKAVLPYMRKQNYGRILVTSSQCGKKPFANLASYNASKAAAILFSQTLAAEVCDQNIRVNIVLPGDVNTEMVDGEAKLIAERTGQDVSEVRKSIGAQVPIGHAAEPEEIADIFLILASDYANYMTGATINATGGEMYY